MAIGQSPDIKYVHDSKFAKELNIEDALSCIIDMIDQNVN